MVVDNEYTLGIEYEGNELSEIVLYEQNKGQKWLFFSYIYLCINRKTIVRENQNFKKWL